MMGTYAGVRYSMVAIWLHWIIALLIIANIAIGIGHDPLGAVVPGVMNIHKSIGLTVLVLSVLALLWRLMNSPPPLPTTISRRTKRAAALMHRLLYALMILMPLTGWIMSSAGPRPLNWFNVFDVPKFAVARGDAIVTVAGSHEVLGLIFGALVIGHIGAALWHQFIRRDGLIIRMV
ncbi:cytochrome b561 [Sphingobium sp. B8D3C]|nr:cytochrome b561 [Sphingobium sp. B8D3B]MCW2417767.1 cytochrome b561 [Sphingobium sp. B8D3C]